MIAWALMGRSAVISSASRAARVLESRGVEGVEEDSVADLVEGSVTESGPFSGLVSGWVVVVVMG